MLAHAYQPASVGLPTCFGGRMILPQSGGFIDDLLGKELMDPLEPKRLWMVHSFFTSAPGRNLGGLRARVLDQKGVVSFINQRDIEVILQIGKPGEYCRWLGKPYVAPGDRDWYGFCMDDTDLMDDLHTREIELRAERPILRGFMDDQIGLTDTTGLGCEINRIVHLERGYDIQETYLLRCDVDFNTGARPDNQLRTIKDRWVRSERNRIEWDRI